MSPSNTIRKSSLQRIAALLCAALAACGLAGRVSAQTGPLLTSPPVPTPYQWQNYHSGGAPIPTTQFSVMDPNAVGLTPLIDPFQGQLQGTPTELYNGEITQIPSYVLGNYNPLEPPGGLVADGTGGLINSFFPNHFQDGTIFQWSAPFDFMPQTTGQVTVDDGPLPSTAPTYNASGVATASGFTATSAWTSVTAPGAATPGNDTSPAAENATNAEYLRLAPGISGSAVWTLVEPDAGNYSLYLHIPSDLPDSAGNAEPRDTQVVYFIRVLDAAGNVTTSTTATASQTEANDSQFLAGPFQIVAGGSVAVTLTRSSSPVINNGADYLVADSLTLQETIGDVQSAPTVITRDSYVADFDRAQYWGVYVPTQVSTTSISGTATPAQDEAYYANPDTDTGNSVTTGQGNILLKTGNPTTAVAADHATSDPTRLIRQLVYFGRSDPSASVTTTVDDNSAGFTGNGSTIIDTTGTASNGEYHVSTPTPGTPGPTTNPVAQWTVPVPAAGAGSSFFVYAHIPATPTGQTRLSQVFYKVTINTGTAAAPVFASYLATISQVTQGTDALVALPTGALQPAVATDVTVQMYSENGTTSVSPTNAVVVADSVNVSTGTGQGAIYCVDGFTGGVLWRFETPGSANGASAPVFASPAIARINVYTPATSTTAAGYQNKLVVIVGDNNGLVYCLDAIGNGDGTSNAAVLNQTTFQPNTIPQPAYGTAVAPLAANTPYATAAATAHVGTTPVYWIYRPDANSPKYVSGASIGTIKPVDPTTDLPVPAAFNTASPNIFVDPSVYTGAPTTANPAPAAPTASNSIVYIGNSNGVLYALDGGGAPIDGTSAATYAKTGDTFNVSQTGTVFDIPGAGNPYLTAVVPTTQTLWWFSLRGVDPNSATNTSSADIESAPAVYIHTLATAVTVPPIGNQTTTLRTTTYQPTVYIGSAHEMESTSNVGRLYALNGLYGPAGDNGQVDPSKQPVAASANYTGPGSFNYNVMPHPAINASDKADWTFPDAYGTYTTPSGTVAGLSSSGKARPALGNITGSPVVFTNIDETTNPTRVYIAANSGYESTTATPVPTARPDDTTTGRVWAVNLDGSVGTTTNLNATLKHVWVYPLAFDPNDATKDDMPEPDTPIGSFLRATPAIGFVQFPTTISIADTNGTGTTGSYAPGDAVHNPINGQSVPMLYLGTEGTNDTALYAIDIDGDMTSDSEGTVTTATDTRTIYRVVSPDGSIFQSSVALITNATEAGGNGGDIYAVAGDTLYDYGATPISNPESSAANNGANEDFPLIPTNAAFVGYGPISSPAIVGADVSDLVNITNPTGNGTTPPPFTLYNGADTEDWVIVGDSSSGLCRGISPIDASYGGIPLATARIVPPNPNPGGTALLNALMQTFLVPTLANVSSSQALPVGTTAPLQVYDWGESVYACFTNVAPPNPINPSTGFPDPTKFVYDSTLYPSLAAAGASNPVPFYTSDGSAAQTVTFSLSDADTTTTSPLLLDNGSLNPSVLSTATLNAANTASSALNGYVLDPGTLPTSFASVIPFVQNLKTEANTRYLGVYTYTIADGTARNNTPGARRRFLNVKQNVTEWDYMGGDATLITSYQKSPNSVVLTGDATGNNIVVRPGTQSFEKVPAIDQPTFGILNPLAVRGGGVPVLPANSVSAVPVGDELGPFRGVDTSQSALPTATNSTGDTYALQALTNGNTVLSYAPPSTTGSGGNPILRPEASNDPAGVTAPTTTEVVVTTTGEISHNTTGGNLEAAATAAPTGVYNSGSDGLQGTGYGGYSLDVFDRGALFNLAQSLRLKMTVPTNTLFAPPSGKDSIYWNSNFSNDGPNQNVATNQNLDTTGHSSVVNFLPWETPPTPYQVGGTNGSQDYPDIAPGNITQTLQTITNSSNVTNAAGDLTSNNITLTPAVAGGGTNTIKTRRVYADPVNIQIAVPNHQPANQQLYQEAETATSDNQHYLAAGQVAPVTEAGANNISGADYAFPMGYVTTKRLYVPNANGFYTAQRPYRDVRIYTGVKVDMRTSVDASSQTINIGKAPAAFGVQTENDPAYSLFTPYGSLASGTYQQSPFQTYFKPVEIHNDGNVNLLNVHLDQKAAGASNNPQTLDLYSDSADPLTFLQGYDLSGITGPRTASLMGTSVAEQPFLIRSSVDTDLIAAYGRNPGIVGNVQFPGEQNGTNPSPNISTLYPGATFHKPVVGSDQSSTLMVPDAPEQYVPGASPGSAGFLVSPSGLPVMPNSGVTYQAQPYVSLAFPFGTPVGTYHTAAPQATASLRLFEGLDTGQTSYNLNAPATATSPPPSMYPPQYSGAVGGIGAPGAPLTDVYTSAEPISTTGAQLIGQVVEQRLTDGATYGAVPMIDAGPAGPTTQANGVSTQNSTPDFAPAAFRDPATGNLSVYWTSGRSNNSFSIFGANLPFTLPSANSSAGYFLPTNPAGQWWNPFTPAVQTGAVNSGLSISQGVPGSPIYAFNVGVSAAAGPYSNTLYSYTVNPTNGTLTALGAVTPPASSAQVKYGVHGLYTGASFSNTPNTPNLWAFWTASTRGRTAIYYNSLGSNGTWIPTATTGSTPASTVALLPVPAGLTAVSDVSPMLMLDAPVNGVYGSVMEATYSGTAPDGSINLYNSRYLPDSKTPSQLDLVAFPPITENLKAAAGWYQARDVAWSRTGVLNVSVSYRDNQGIIQTPPSLLYQGTSNTPQFTNAIYDKSSGLLVLTGVKVPIIPASGAVTQYTTNTVYVDSATGRIRFSPALLTPTPTSTASQTFTQIQALFSPQARRLTTDSRANTAAVTFLDDTLKPNDTPSLGNVVADRRWVIWRKAGIAGTAGSASLYFKTQRLTLCLPTAINVTATQSGTPPVVTNTVNLTSVTLNGVDVTNKVDVDYAQGRIYFPLSLNAEGQTAAATYVEAGTVTTAAPNGVTVTTPATDTVQWQDEPLFNNSDALPAGTAAGLDTIIDNAVPIDNAANENNVAAFLDPYAGTTLGGTTIVTGSHKVWLFWNSTRNGTADIYSETIDPRFAPGPTTQ